MKCLCGYYHVDTSNKWSVERFAEDNNLSEEDVIKNNGKEEFESMTGTFDMKPRFGFGRDPFRVILYICPECNTIKFGEKI